MTARRRRLVAAYFAGVLCANSLPHLATAVSGHRHLTPLAGKQSSHWVNLVWGAGNLAAGLVLISRQRGGARWDSRLVAFDAGAATFAAWMVLSDGLVPVNWSAGD